MVENQQHVVSVTLANNSSLLCNSGHLPVTSTPARVCPQLCHFVIPLVIIHRLIVWLKYHADIRLSVSDITSTTCRGIDSQSLVSDLCYSSGTSDKSLLSTTDSSSLESWSSRSDISSNSSTSQPASNSTTSPLSPSSTDVPHAECGSCIDQAK